jgi:putative endonuclease
MTQFYVYIFASDSRVLYVGVTNDLERRVEQHRAKLLPGFTSRYIVTRLVWYEMFPDATQAIAAEKRIKGRTRAKKIARIEASNPFWDDLFDRSCSHESGRMLRYAQHDKTAPLRSEP